MHEMGISTNKVLRLSDLKSKKFEIRKKKLENCKRAETDETYSYH
jgi:hypothetical protein